MDGTITTQPEFSFWFIDVGWGVENYGTDPDYDVDIAPQDYRDGKDPQIGLRARVDGASARELRRSPARLSHATVAAAANADVTRRLPAALPEIALLGVRSRRVSDPRDRLRWAVSHEPASWDTAELQGVPYILGISHPTGFPIYVLLGWVWSHALPIGTIAFRMNAFSAIAVATAVGCAYAVALQLGARRPVALLAVLWLAFAHTIWAHAIRAEAQDFALAFSTIAIYAIVRSLKGGSNAWYAGAFALYGLALAAHPNADWILPDSCSRRSSQSAGPRGG